MLSARGEDRTLRDSGEELCARDFGRQQRPSHGRRLFRCAEAGSASKSEGGGLVRQRLGVGPPFVAFEVGSVPRRARELERHGGKYFMSGNGVTANALFEHPLNEYKGVISGAGIVDYVASDPKRGFYGGGRLTARGYQTPLDIGLDGLSPEAPRWGAGYKKALREESQPQDDDQLFRHADASRNKPRRSGPRCERRLGPARDAHHLDEPSRRLQEHGVLPEEVHRNPGGCRSEESMGASHRRYPGRRA